MAKNFTTERPTQFATDAEYLLGKAQNITTAGDNTGSPWVADVIDDLILGPASAEMYEADLEPDGQEEKAGQSQRVQAKKILAQDAMWGDKFVGTFKKGCEITSADQVVRGAPNVYWQWQGALPKVVSAGDVPSSPDYEQLAFNEASNISFSESSDAETALRNRTPYITLTEAQTSDLKVGQYVRLTDKGNAPCEVVSAGHTGGYYYATLPNGNRLKLRVELNDPVVFAEWFGFGESANTPAENSTALQTANDTLASLFTVVDGLGNGGGSLSLPTGQHKFEGFVLSNGVNPKGAGKNKTVLRLVGDNKTGIKNASADSGLGADQVQYGILEGMSIVPDEPNRAGLIGQVMLDAVGFSRFTFRDLFIGWCGGAIGIRATGSPTAGTGGPAMWYNDWQNCFVERASGWNSGGVGWLLGEADNTLEQVTTWTILGGRTSGAGTGINIQGANTVSFVNHVIESTDVIIGSDSGPRVTRNINFYPVYLEGSATFTNNSPSCSFFGEFVTSYTVVENDNILRHGTTGFHSVVRSAGAGQWIVDIENGAVKRPKFQGSTFPAIDLINSNGSDNDVTVANGRNISDSTSIFTVRKNNNAAVVFEVGDDFLRAGTDGVLNIGAPASRCNTVYATNNTINTSDEREKQQIHDITPELLAVGKRIMALNKTYKWNSSVDEKGGDARTHIGLIAQDVITAFEAEGLSAFEYGAVCYDEWEDEWEDLPEVTDEDGSVIQEAQCILRVKAGSRYGLRFQQLNELRFAYINSVLEGL